MRLKIHSTKRNHLNFGPQLNVFFQDLSLKKREKFVLKKQGSFETKWLTEKHNVHFEKVLPLTADHGDVKSFCSQELYTWQNLIIGYVLIKRPFEIFTITLSSGCSDNILLIQFQVKLHIQKNVIFPHGTIYFFLGFQ